MASSLVSPEMMDTLGALTALVQAQGAMLAKLIGTQNDVIRSVAGIVMESNRRMATHGIATKEINAKCTEAVNHTQLPTAEASSYAQPRARKRPLVITLDDDEQEPRKKAAALDIKPTRQALNATTGQVPQGVAARESNAHCPEVVNDTQISLAAASSYAQPAAQKRPRTELSCVTLPAPSFRNLQTLRSAQQRSYFDCICEVIGVFHDGDHVILRVWDGTKPSRRLTRYRHAQRITVDSELEASVNDYAVDICCWDEHATSARVLLPRDKVSLVNVDARLIESRLETYTMHRGGAYGRCIRRLQSPQHVEKLERQLSAVRGRPSPQSQRVYDGPNPSRPVRRDAASVSGRQPALFRS